MRGGGASKTSSGKIASVLSRIDRTVASFPLFPVPCGAAGHAPTQRNRVKREPARIAARTLTVRSVRHCGISNKRRAQQRGPSPPLAFRASSTADFQFRDLGAPVKRFSSGFMSC